MISTQGEIVAERAMSDTTSEPPPSAPPVRPDEAAGPPTPAVTLDFDAFCRREYATVTALAFVLTGDWTAAEDLTQDAFFAAYRRWDTLCEYDKPGAWVRRAVANRAVSRRRRLRSELRALTRLGVRRPNGPEHAEIPQPDVEVWAMVRQLSTRQAQVFALTYVEDLPLDQVAVILQITEDTARTHLKRARAALIPRRPTADDPGSGTVAPEMEGPS